MVLIYSFHIFGRSGDCVYQLDLKRPRTEPLDIEGEERQKFLFGMLYILKRIATRLSPVQKELSYIGYSTSKYKLHMHETDTGLKFVLLTDTDPQTSTQTTVLEYLRVIYRDLYVPLVVKNPSGDVNGPVNSELFHSALEKYFKSLEASTQLSEKRTN